MRFHYEEKTAITRSLHNNANIHVNGFNQDCGISSAIAMETLQSCTKPLVQDLRYLSTEFYLPISMEPVGAVPNGVELVVILLSAWLVVILLSVWGWKH